MAKYMVECIKSIASNITSYGITCKVSTNLMMWPCKQSTRCLDAKKINNDLFATPTYKVCNNPESNVNLIPDVNPMLDEILMPEKNRVPDFNFVSGANLMSNWNLNLVTESNLAKESIMELNSNLMRDSNLKRDSNQMRDSNLKRDSNQMRDSNLMRDSHVKRDLNLMKDSNQMRDSKLMRDYNLIRDSNLMRGLNLKRDSNLMRDSNLNLISDFTFKTFGRRFNLKASKYDHLQMRYNKQLRRKLELIAESSRNSSAKTTKNSRLIELRYVRYALNRVHSLVLESGELSDIMEHYVRCILNRAHVPKDWNPFDRRTHVDRAVDFLKNTTIYKNATSHLQLVEDIIQENYRYIKRSKKFLAESLKKTGGYLAQNKMKISRMKVLALRKESKKYLVVMKRKKQFANKLIRNEFDRLVDVYGKIKGKVFEEYCRRLVRHVNYLRARSQKSDSGIKRIVVDERKIRSVAQNINIVQEKDPSFYILAQRTHKKRKLQQVKKKILYNK